jgi:nucleoside-diphosphate-sugar epimerase
MRVAVTGGTGTVGKQTVLELAERGHEVCQLSRRAPTEPNAGAAHYSVDLTTGAGLDRALDGIQAVVDAANSMASFRLSREVLVGGSGRLAAAAAAAGVEHHVLRSIVGIEDVPTSYY